MSDEMEQERRAGAIEELRRRIIARSVASKIPAEIDALKFGDSSLTPAQREIISRIPVALSPMNMHQKMSEAEAEIGRLTVEQDAAVIAEQAAAERTRADQIVAAVESAREDLLRVWHKARRVDGQDVDTPHTDAISAVCNALFYAAEMPSVVHKDGGNEEIGRNILRIKAWEYYQRIEKAEAERDAARAEVERLRAACSHREDMYPTETVVIRGAPELLEELSQIAFFLGDVRKSKEASYRAQYIRAALESEADDD